MAIPKRGSRSLVVDSQAYRWYVRRKPSHRQADFFPGTMGLAVQSADAAHGAVLVVELPRRHPDRGGRTDEPITPAEVAAYVRAALAGGWKPHESGPMHFVKAEPAA